MIASGELFLLNGESCGESRPLPGFVNQNIRVIAAKFDRAYVVVEPASPKDGAQRQWIVWCFTGDSGEPTLCPEFDVITESIRQIAIGAKHLLVLTHQGDVYSRGEAVYGSVGHGGANHAPDFKLVPGLKGRRVKFIAAGPYFSIAITQEGDVYSWGQSFNGETGLFTQVNTVPRFASAVTPFRVVSISCGHSHVLACTETQQCIAWGENTCGQLGVGHKTKPTFKPQLLDTIPSQIAGVSAGWAHSVAVGAEGRVYVWGLNSHGQLGLGDTQTRLAPHLLHALVGVCQVQTAHASRAMTIFYTSASKSLLCGMVPCSPTLDSAVADFAPIRPGETDPVGCLLCPVPMGLSTRSLHGRGGETIKGIRSGCKVEINIPKDESDEPDRSVEEEMCKAEDMINEIIDKAAAATDAWEALAKSRQSEGQKSEPNGKATSKAAPPPKKKVEVEED